VKVYITSAVIDLIFGRMPLSAYVSSMLKTTGRHYDAALDEYIHFLKTTIA